MLVTELITLGSEKAGGQGMDLSPQTEKLHLLVAASVRDYMYYLRDRAYRGRTGKRSTRARLRSLLRSRYFFLSDFQGKYCHGPLKLWWALGAGPAVSDGEVGPLPLNTHEKQQEQEPPPIRVSRAYLLRGSP